MKMSDKELIFFTDPSGRRLFAARPKTGSAIMFVQTEKKWKWSFHDCFQLEVDCAYAGFDNITPDEAKAIYQDILPDEKLLDEYEQKIANALRDV